MLQARITGVLVTISLCCPLVSFSPAQTSRNKQSIDRIFPTPSTTEQTAKDKSEELLVMQRQFALNLLDQLLGQTRELNNEQLKALLMAQVADALWEYNESRARSGFKEALNIIGKVMQEQQGYDPSLTRLRSEILSLAARRDAALAETLIESIVKTGKDKGGLPAGVTGTEDQALLYLQTALALADSNPRQAAELALSSLSRGFTSAVLPLLQRLQQKDSALADDLFTRTLSAIQGDPARARDYLALLAMYALPGFGEPAVRMNLGLENRKGAPSPSNSRSAGKRLKMIDLAERVSALERQTR